MVHAASEVYLISQDESEVQVGIFFQSDESFTGLSIEITPDPSTTISDCSLLYSPFSGTETATIQTSGYTCLYLLDSGTYDSNGGNIFSITFEDPTSTITVEANVTEIVDGFTSLNAEDYSIDSFEVEPYEEEVTCDGNINLTLAYNESDSAFFVNITNSTVVDWINFSLDTNVTLDEDNFTASASYTGSILSSLNFTGWDILLFDQRIGASGDYYVNLTDVSTNSVCPVGYENITFTIEASDPDSCEVNLQIVAQDGGTVPISFYVNVTNTSVVDWVNFTVEHNFTGIGSFQNYSTFSGDIDSSLNFSAWTEPKLFDAVTENESGSFYINLTDVSVSPMCSVSYSNITYDVSSTFCGEIGEPPAIDTMYYDGVVVPNDAINYVDQFSIDVSDTSLQTDDDSDILYGEDFEWYDSNCNLVTELTTGVHYVNYVGGCSNYVYGDLGTNFDVGGDFDYNCFDIDDSYGNLDHDSYRDQVSIYDVDGDSDFDRDDLFAYYAWYNARLGNEPLKAEEI